MLLCGPSEYFPSFSEGLSLRGFLELLEPAARKEFPFLFGGTFIEGPATQSVPPSVTKISLPFRRDFH